VAAFIASVVEWARATPATSVPTTAATPARASAIRTRNSVYVLRVNPDGTFDAEGGWFSREEASGLGLKVAGCTWGGSAILTRMIAAPGMFLEFGNRVRTTRIREVRHLRCAAAPTVH